MRATPVELRVPPRARHEGGAGLGESEQTREVAVATIEQVKCPGRQEQAVEQIDIVDLASRHETLAGMLPRRSSRACNFTALLWWRNCAQGNSAKHKSMVVESKA